MQNGEICVDILKKEWSPAWSLQSACRAIIALLADPASDRYYFFFIRYFQFPK